jgi:hypothetical protein
MLCDLSNIWPVRVDGKASAVMDAESLTHFMLATLRIALALLVMLVQRPH